MCCKRLFFPVCTGTNSTAKPLHRFIKVFFHNKGIDKVKLTAILHNKLVRSKVPIYFQEQDPPLVSYKYTNNISRSVFNYNQTIRNINLADYHNALCDCESSAFRFFQLNQDNTVDELIQTHATSLADVFDIKL